ncbi:alpha/beta fold hydrolase [Sneathiella sp.]|uniref:alpha/beta hydrolase n=1 Tax=Sneathiella sp. TaxID=1964365 RepID=UPI0026044B70|nr:alpha/beta fold hydrolase [Sneathiella sp.]MDF2366486.1 alpha/beta fold hydrolase [Sneathiella sp.]
MTLPRKISLWLFALLMIFVVIPSAVMYFFQGLVVFPVPEAENPAEAVGGFAPVVITTPDGERLRAFYSPPGEMQASILVFHGNAETAANQIPRGEALSKAGFGVLLVEYRGYGGSTGEPTQDGVILDGLAAYDFLAAQSDQPIGILAHSLGTGVAIPVAAARAPFAVVLEAPFTSLLAIARYRMGWAPLDFMMKYPFHNDDVIGEVTAPILIIHGTADKVIPFEEGETLAALAPTGTAFIRIEGAGHNNLGRYGDMKMATSFFTKALAADQ